VRQHWSTPASLPTKSANTLRREGATQGVLIALVAHLADLFPDMAIAQLSVALQEAKATATAEQQALEEAMMEK